MPESREIINKYYLNKLKGSSKRKHHDKNDNEIDVDETEKKTDCFKLQCINK